jgi:hypothetical protein
MSVNSTSLNLIKPGPKDISYLLVIGSYISTAIAMMLTLTSYFSIKAYMLRSTNVISPPVTPPVSPLKDTKPKKMEDSNKKSFFRHLFKKEKQIVKEIKTESIPVEKPVPQVKPNEPKENKVTPKEVVPPAGPDVKIVKTNWKKIEVKIPEEPVDKLADNRENIAPVESTIEKPVDLNKNKIETESITNKIDDAKEIKEITTDKKETSIIEPLHENDSKIYSIKPIEAIQKDIYSEKKSSIEEPDRVMLDSEVIKTLEELKEMVKDMKNSLKK